MITKQQLDQYEPTIGIECHVQLKTATKLFSGADNDAREAEPNSLTSPLCFGLPGTLPVLNRQAVQLAMRAGVALNAEIAAESSFDRKHYFYPDLPKGYQITQLDRPTVGRGHVDVPLGGETFKVGIVRAHIEEDAGKSTHPDGAAYSLIDLNRAGTPLIEIVSDPDMHSAAQAKAYVQELYLLMKYADVSDCNLYYGNMRFDVNISVAKKGSGTLGTRAEVKNLNSFRSVERVVEYEFLRQVELVERGQAIKQETRGWHDAKQKTFSQRSKEEAEDYRYFPEPDVPPVQITQADIDAVTNEVSEHLPANLRRRMTQAGVRTDAAETLLLADATIGLDYVSTVLKVESEYGHEAATFTANFLVNRDIKERKDVSVGSESNNLPSATQFADVHKLIKSNQLSSNNADILLFKLRTDPATDARVTAQKLQLLQESNLDALQQIVDDVLADPASAQAVQDIQNGQERAIGYLVGQVMKRSQGKANPALANQLLRKSIGD